MFFALSSAHWTQTPNLHHSNVNSNFIISSEYCQTTDANCKYVKGGLTLYLFGNITNETDLVIKTVSDAMSNGELNEVNETIVKITLINKYNIPVIIDRSTGI